MTGSKPDFDTTPGGGPFRRVALLLALSLALLAPQAPRADPPGPPASAGARSATGVETLRPDAATPRPRKRVFAGEAPDRRCTGDGRHCIALASYIPDVCRTIEAVATEAGLDADFFARLLWKESLFDSNAISPVGAQGIAQFMPGTARLRQLDDPFNPAKALRASAQYLAELRDWYGNLGLAAAAYNAGEARVDDFVLRDRVLPPETRAYVPAITGHSGREWRDDPPAEVDLTLETGLDFQAACVKLAENRSLAEFRRPSTLMPWAVIVAAHQRREMAQFKYSELRRNRSVLRDYRIDYVRMRLPARHGTQYTAQIGVADRSAANALCGKLRRGSVPCIVLRN